MIDGIEPLYRVIAESMVGKLEAQGPWATAWMYAIFYTESILYSGEYVATVGAKPKSFGTDIRGENAFEEIRELFKAAGKPLWGRAWFELHSDGKFKMDWSYDDCDADGCAKFDEEVDDEAEIERMRELRDRPR